MNPRSDPYDELPYSSFPVEWTAPERLALTSLLHGGPRPSLKDYRVLELGCGNGANLLPLAFFRRHATFLGVDAAASPIKEAKDRQAALQLANVEFIRADFRTASRQIEGTFDFVLAHGVFSWVNDEARDALLHLISACLRPGGLFYLNYNARPGWNVRGLVREFLLAQTENRGPLRARAEHAQEVAARIASALERNEHPYSRLLANEFRFVRDGNVAWVGHEFLALDNHPYWRSEFLALARNHELEYVADADFNYASGRIPPELARRLQAEQLVGRSIDDTVDLLCYRQLHSPILTTRPLDRQLADTAELGNLIVASCLEPRPPNEAGNAVFKHPTGFEVEAREEEIQTAFNKLLPLWPRGLQVNSIFSDVRHVEEDLRMLHRNGLIELRCAEPWHFEINGDALNRLERDWGGYVTTPYHQCQRWSG